MLRAKNLVAGVAMVMASGVMGLQAVSATEFRFDQVDEGPASSLAYTVDGVTATATGLSLADSLEDTWNTRNVQTLDSKGMGTSSGGVSPMTFDTLWFSFSEALTFTSAEFYLESGSARVYVLDANGQGLYNTQVQAGLSSIDLSSLAYTGDVIGFRARFYQPGELYPPIKPSAANWYLAALAGEVPAQAVPTPAAAGLGLIGLAGLAMRRRRENG